MHVKPMERGWKPHAEISPACPRCGSPNTKFCYYNNYSLTQPRYFCKGCRRYWTKGGSLRNVPVGGGCRKSRRGKSFRDVISIPPRAVSGGRPVVALGGRSGMTTPITLSPPANGGPFARGADHRGSNIDLTLVYANFLNQKPPRPNEADSISINSPRYHPQIEIPSLPNSLGLGGGPMPFQFPGPLLQQENGFLDQCRPLSSCQSSETHFSNAFYLSGLDSLEKQRDYEFMSTGSTGAAMENRTNIHQGLPPFPGHEELIMNTVVSEGLVWSGSNHDHLIFPSQTMHTPILSAGIEEQTVPLPHTEAQEPKLLVENIGSQVNVPIELSNIFRP